MTEMEERSGATLVIKGTVTAGEDLVLGGRVEGTIRVPGHMLTLGPGAEVTADVQAHTVVVSGAVRGDVRATEKVGTERNRGCFRGYPVAARGDARGRPVGGPHRHAGAASGRVRRVGRRGSRVAQVFDLGSSGTGQGPV